MNMQFNFAAHTIPGIYHSAVGKDNEDAVKFYEDDTVIMVAVSDGCSSSAYAQAAAVASCEGALSFGQCRKIWELVQKSHIKQLKMEFLKYLDDAYYATNFPYDELMATIVLIVINKISRQYAAFSIGDSSALIIDNNLEAEILLNPVRMGKNKTMFGNSAAASTTMKVSMGLLQNVSGFVLFTDGADALREKASALELQYLAATAQLRPEIADKEITKLCEKYRQNGQDDVTIALLSVNCPAAQNVSAKIYPELQKSSNHTTVPVNNSLTDNTATAETTQAEEADNEWNDWLYLPEFLETPKTAAQIVEAGFTSAPEILTFLRPYLLDGIVEYHPNTHCFSLRQTKG